MKRIFTHVMRQSLRCLGLDGTGWYTDLAVDTFVAQEDIEIIGAQLIIEICGQPTVDGMYICRGVISQSGQIHKDGEFLQAIASYHYGAVVGAQEMTMPSGEGPGYQTVMFPEGCSIPLKEEGTIYLHCQYRVPTNVAVVDYGVNAIVYYIKKGAR